MIKVVVTSVHNDDDDEDNVEIEEGDHIFVATIHPEDIHHFVRASSTVSQQLAEAFTRNSRQASF